MTKFMTILKGCVASLSHPREFILFITGWGWGRGALLFFFFLGRSYITPSALISISLSFPCRVLGLSGRFPHPHTCCSFLELSILSSIPVTEPFLKPPPPRSPRKQTLLTQVTSPLQAPPALWGPRWDLGDWWLSWIQIPWGRVTEVVPRP